jgi:hypothetical protein
MPGIRAVHPAHNSRTPDNSRKVNTTQLADRRLGGKILVDYLFELFAASPLELFSRVGVLTVLEQVKKDKSLFPDKA